MSALSPLPLFPLSFSLFFFFLLVSTFFLSIANILPLLHPVRVPVLVLASRYRPPTHHCLMPVKGIQPRCSGSFHFFPPLAPRHLIAIESHSVAACRDNNKNHMEAPGALPFFLTSHAPSTKPGLASAAKAVPVRRRQEEALASSGFRSALVVGA